MTEGEDSQTAVAQQEAPISELSLLLGAERQLWAKAYKKAEETSDDEGQTFFEREAITEAMVESGDLQEAERMIRRFDLGHSGVELALASAYARSGDIAKARELARDDYDMMKAVADIQAESGDVEGALKTVYEAKSANSDIQDTYGLIAKKYVELGNIEAAFALTNLSDDQYFKAAIYADIAAAQASTGKIEDAVQTYEKNKGLFDGGEDQYVLETITKAYAKAGDEWRAYKTAQTIWDQGTQEKFRQDQIDQLVLRGVAANGHEAADEQVEKISETMKAGLAKFWLYKDLYSDTDDIYYLKKAMDQVGGEDQILGEYLTTYAVALAKNGEVEKALKLASRFKGDEGRDQTTKVFEEIAIALATRGDVDASLNMLTEHEQDIAYSQDYVKAYARVAAGIHKYRMSRHSDSESTTHIEADLSTVDHRDAKRIGASALEQWKSFKAYKPTTFARLAHGAAEIAHAYMTDEERRAFIRDLANEFRQFRDKGMFDDGHRQAVLKHMGEALIELEDPAATGHLLETLYKNMGEATGLRLIKTLVESGNAKAGAAGIAVLCDPETPEHVYQYLLHKLSKTGYIDEKLPEKIEALHSWRSPPFPPWASRYILQRFYNDLNVQSDSSLLEWAAERTSYGKMSMEEKWRLLEDTTAEKILEKDLDEIISKARESLQRFEDLDQEALLNHLASNLDDRAIYFMLKAGRTKYTLIQHYNFDNFSGAVSKAAEIQARVDPKLIDDKLWSGAPDGWREAMVNRHRPDGSLVWQTEVGAASTELREAARKEVEDVLGLQLSWLLRFGLDEKNFDPNYEDIVSKLSFQEREKAGLSLEDINKLSSTQQLEYLLGEKAAKKLRAILGDSISGAIDVENSESDITVGDFEKAKNALLAQLRQMRNTAKQNKNPLVEQWKSVIERAEQEDPIIAMRHILALLTNNPELSLRPNGAVAEWVGHITGLDTRVREAQKTGSGNRNLTLRYLDGREDFAEMLRFADGAQCCFTSKNTIGAVMDPAGEWRMRINRDPHWFVFSIEDTPPDAETRISSGFIFGSVARVDGQPALALNGVYMQRKTNTAGNAILEQIIERFARPLGMRFVLVGATFGGEFEPDKSVWQPAGGRTLFRPRAIVDEDGNPEQRIYDDLGETVNADQPVSAHCWIRTV